MADRPVTNTIECERCGRRYDWAGQHAACPHIEFSENTAPITAGTGTFGTGTLADDVPPIRPPDPGRLPPPVTMVRPRALTGVGVGGIDVDPSRIETYRHGLDVRPDPRLDLEAMIEAVRFKSTIDVELVQHVGSDQMVAHAARVSTLGMLSSEEQDKAKAEGVINYLMRNRHGTPFEHGLMTVRVHAPIKVWREWHRHRVGWSYNEESGRYKDLDPLFWLPPRERPSIRPEGFKSARPDFEPMTDGQHKETVQDLKEGYAFAYMKYRRMLDRGVDRGLARDVLGVGVFSAGYCTANPRSIMAFLELRTRHDDARRPSRPLWEIDSAARQVEGHFAGLWPTVHAAWVANGRMAP